MSSRPSVALLEAPLLVATGGFAGAALRLLVSRPAPGPLGTMLVNVLGCFALGFLVYAATNTDVVPERANVLVGTGFLSSFTTYSTFVLDAVSSGPLVAGGYVAGSYALGFAAVLAGRSTVHRLVAARAGPSAPGGDR